MKYVQGILHILSIELVYLLVCKQLDSTEYEKFTSGLSEKVANVRGLGEKGKNKKSMHLDIVRKF